MTQSAYENYKFRAVTGEAVQWKGFWITSRRFYHLPYIQQFGYNRIPEFNGEIQNIHTLFLKKFTLKDIPVKSAKLFISGDDLYKVYVNSEFVGEGPAQSFPGDYYYNCYDVTDMLRSGTNAIGVHLYYQGLFNIFLLSSDNLCGMILQLEITYTDGSTQSVISDHSWRCRESDAFSARYVYGYETCFSEDIDFNKWNPLWHSIHTCTEEWENVYITGNPQPLIYNLRPQITPPIKYEKIYPKKIEKIEKGYFFDFGKEYAGVLSMCLKGEKGHTVNIRYGEELNPDGTVRYDIRANCTYDDIITLCGKEMYLENFDYKGFRYAEVLNIPEDFDEKSVFLFSRNYPFPDEPAKFSCSDPLLNNIWDICAQGTKVGTQDTYYDCPTRERGGFVGDAYVTGLSHLILTGDIRVYKKFIEDLKNSSRYCPALACQTPSYNIAYIAEYSLLAPLFIQNYYNYTADTDFVKDVIIINKGVMEYFAQFENDMGMLEGIKAMEKVPKELKPIIIDWPPSLRDDYEFEESQTGICTLVNMFYYGFLKSYAELCGIIGDDKQAQELTDKYVKLKSTIIETCYDAEKKLFKDLPHSNHTALHSNIMALFFNIVPPDGFEGILSLVKEKGLKCNLYFPYFLLKGLYATGNATTAYKLLTNKTIYSWSNMIEAGATCCMEAWSADFKANVSFCHPMESAPIIIIKEEILGIKDYNPLTNTITICPNIPDELDFMELVLPLPCGKVSAGFEKKSGETYYFVKTYADVNIQFYGEGIKFKRL